MISRHKPSKLLYRRTQLARERSSLAVASEAHRTRIIGERRFVGDQKAEDSSSTTMRPVIGCNGYKKRYLVTMTAAVACMIPSYATMVLASGENSPGNFGRTNGFGTRRSYSYHAGKQFDTNNQRSLSDENIPLLKVLQTLIRRLNEPVPLRAADVSNKESSSEAEEKRRMAELAEELVVRYSFLPPLRRFGMEFNGEISDENYTCERSDMLEFLAMECCPSMPSIETAMDDYKTQQHPTSTNNFEKLKKATTPIFEGLTEFVLQQNAVTGMGFLVALREDLLSSLRYQNQQQQEASAEAKVRQQRFKDLDTHLKAGVFEQWFVPGLLLHERITYESTPAKIIEAIATKEAVHPMKSLDDLKDRLGSSKRVFALFHPCLPNRPLVFVHVALLPQGLPSSMEEIMSTKSKNGQSEPSPQVAAFYSISNGVKGLAGVGLGEYLLKESIKALKEELSSLQTFVTLSPIPKFRKWIEVSFLKEEQKHQQYLLRSEPKEFTSSLLSENDREALYRCGFVSSDSPFPWKEFLERLEKTDFKELIEQAKTTTDDDIFKFLSSHQDNAEAPGVDAAAMLQREQFFVLRTVLLKLACSYLWMEKHRGKPLDKVCNFHVGNGAELHDLHFGADLSRGGLSNSYGLMVNYLYDMDKISTNQANFESSGFVVPVGPGVRKWLE